ncbi:MAG: hypothetical protein U0525_05410 [Patescibacteria group bacterium]
MRILVVNNESLHSHQLVNACRHNGRNDVEYSWHELPNKDLTSFDLIVLSGTSKYSIRMNKHLYSYQQKLILESDKPIIGICGGFELICDAYGIPLLKSLVKISGIFPLTPIASDKILIPGMIYSVYERHKMYVPHVDFPLVPLATTNGNIALIKHKYKPIYGMQFHPEVRKSGSNGLLILHNILKVIDETINTS